MFDLLRWKIDNILVKTAIEVVIAVAGFFGVYGIRDALRKISQNL